MSLPVPVAPATNVLLPLTATSDVVDATAPVTSPGMWETGLRNNEKHAFKCTLYSR